VRQLPMIGRTWHSVALRNVGEACVKAPFQ
jgi:hypothetical protein